MPSRHSYIPCRRWLAVASVVALGLVACGDGGRQESDALPPIDYDDALRSRISVSGVSAGAYMAVQSHVAYAEKIGGVAVIAGGPYHCAEGDVKTALGRCMKGTDLNAEPMIGFAGDAATAGTIAASDAMRNAVVWIFHSPADAVVSPQAGDTLAEFYEAFVQEENIERVSHIEAAHGWPTLAEGLACAEQGGDYINACDYDAAGELLRHLFGDLQARADKADPDNLVAIDLSGLFGSGSNVADEGFAYIPSGCTHSTGVCRLHIAFHGCVQGAEFIADRFTRQAGFNEWAESNDIIVVYPQIEASLFNPKGFWDWWGYTGDDYDLRSGKQVVGVSAIIDAYVSGKLLLGLNAP